jgi:hypothetical protein
MRGTPSRWHPQPLDGTSCPVALAIDHRERPLNRLTTALRPFAATPIPVVRLTRARPDVATGDISRGLPRLAP